MTKTYELKNATFTAEVGTPAAVRALSDAEIAALVRNAMSNWSFRRGARKDSDGKHYDFAAVVADMLAVGERSSGPTERDEKQAAKLLFELAGLPRDAAALYRGLKTEAEKDAAVTAFAQKHLSAAAIEAGVIDPELAASDNAETVWNLAGYSVVKRALAKFAADNTEFEHAIDTELDVMTAATEFCAARRRFEERKKRDVNNWL